MSLPASERLAPSRRQRASSVVTSAQNLLWPGQFNNSHGDSSARPSPGLSFRSGEPSEPIGMPASPSNAYSQREPTRSFFHSSFRGQLGAYMLDDSSVLCVADVAILQHPMIASNMPAMFGKIQRSLLRMRSRSNLAR